MNGILLLSKSSGTSFESDMVGKSHNLPNNCLRGSNFELQHASICKRGGL